MTRPIRADEAAVANWMLTQASVVGPLVHLLASVAALQVVWNCNCGCASVGFEPNVPEPRAKILADATGKTVEGSDVGIILWGREQRISGLEVYGYERSDVGLPTLASLKAS